MTSTPRIAFALGLCALAGCKETVSSDHIKTGGIAMLTEVTARSETNVTVRTELLVGGDESNTYVILESGDRMYAEVEDQREEMEAIDEGVYEATFDVGTDGAEYRVLLRRDDGDSAEDSMGTLPAPFAITSDLGTEVYSRVNDDVEITWDPSGESDDMSLEIDDDVGGCIFSDRFDVGGDDGSFVIAADTLDSTSSSEPEECDVTATLVRQRDGSNDRNLDSESWFVLRQVRSTTFASGM
jgi:hypothetical protein